MTRWKLESNLVRMSEEVEYDADGRARAVYAVPFVSCLRRSRPDFDLLDRIGYYRRIRDMESVAILTDVYMRDGHARLDSVVPLPG